MVFITVDCGCSNEEAVDEIDKCAGGQEFNHNDTTFREEWRLLFLR